MIQTPEKFKLAIIIVNDAKKKKLAKMLNAKNFNCHYGTLGKGTAPTDMAALWGLSEPEKGIFFVVVRASRVDELFCALEEEFNFTGQKGVGVAFTIPIVSVAHIDIINFLKSII